MSVSVCRKHFGYDSFYLIAHDRGGRVAHRLALDHPKAVLKLMTLDICPTLYMYETTDREFVSPVNYRVRSFEGIQLISLRAD